MDDKIFWYDKFNYRNKNEQMCYFLTFIYFINLHFGSLSYIWLLQTDILHTDPGVMTQKDTFSVQWWFVYSNPGLWKLKEKKGLKVF